MTGPANAGDAPQPLTRRFAPPSPARGEGRPPRRLTNRLVRFAAVLTANTKGCLGVTRGDEAIKKSLSALQFLDRVRPGQARASR